MQLHTNPDRDIEKTKGSANRVSLMPVPTRRMSMRQVALSIFGPITAVAVTVLAITYPSPAELWAGIQPVQRELRVVNAGGPFANSVVQDIASSQLPEPVANQPAANRDCFQNLAFANEAKLERCSRVVYQALIEVEKANRPPLIEALAADDHKRIVERLKFAAAEVCRSSWLKEPVNKADMNSPACEAAEIEIASGTP